MSKERVRKDWEIAHDMSGLRADIYLMRKIGRISRMRAQKIIFEKDFLVNDLPTKPSMKVRFGQKASLLRFAPDSKSDVDQFQVDILFEDENLLVVNKPFGLNIHPNANCLYNALTYWLKKNYPKLRIHPCHRIDKETSGIVVCAKNLATESRVKVSFQEKRIKKNYLAVVEGRLEKKQMIDIPLALQGTRGLVFIRMIEDPLGKKSQTKVYPVKYCEETNRTLVACKPITGRQHQIRAHLSLIGFPIVGDKLYGSDDNFFISYCQRQSWAEDSLKHYRHALHARTLSMKLNKKSFRFKSNIPKDFFELMNF